MTVSVPATIWKEKGSGPLRILIVDDSVVVRTVLERIIVAHPDFEVAHKTSSAAQAIAFLKNGRVDLILLDVEMPGQSGLAALPEILGAGGGAKVVILSGNCEEGSAAAVEALAMGASDIMSKPFAGSFGDQFSSALMGRLSRLLSGGAAPTTAAADHPLSLRPVPSAPLNCIAIGASTGGIHALGQLFGGLPRRPGVPILVTQHLPNSFIPYFADQLARMTTLPVSIAAAGEAILPDHIYIAPGGANLELRRTRQDQVVAMLTAERGASGSLPAVDPMFSAMARTYGQGCCGIVLTGMGRDGSIGARDIVASGGWLVAQDAESSVVWGMPGSVARAGVTSAVLPPSEIMSFIASHVRVDA